MAAQSLPFHHAATFGDVRNPSLVARLIKRIRDEVNARRTAALLNQLSDSQLNDVGLTRFQIESISRRQSGL